MKLISGTARYHVFVFVFTIALQIYASVQHLAYITMFLTEAIVLYIALTHRSRRELLPALSVIVVCKSIGLPLFMAFYSADTVAIYFETIILYNLVLMVCLVKGYRSSHLRWIFKVDTPSRKIPQVLAIVWVLGLGVIFHMLVLAEVKIHEFDPDFFTGVPFFYGNYDTIALTLKLLLLLAVWSMCLDSYYVDYSRYRRGAKNLHSASENDMSV